MSIHCKFFLIIITYHPLLALMLNSAAGFFCKKIWLLYRRLNENISLRPFPLNNSFEVVCSTDTIPEVGAFTRMLCCKNFLVINKESA